MIVPPGPMRNMAKWIKGSPRDLLSEPVRMEFGEKEVKIVHGDFTVISRRVEGSFPNFKDVIPKTAKSSVVIDKEEMVTALTHAMRCTSATQHAVAIEMGKSNVIFRSRGDGRKFERAAKAVVKGKRVSLGLNPDFLLQALKVHDWPTVNLHTDGSAWAFVSGNWTHVIMPVKLGDD